MLIKITAAAVCEANAAEQSASAGYIKFLLHQFVFNVRLLH